MYWDRQLAFAVIIKSKFTDKWKLLKHTMQEADSDDEDNESSSQGISLKSCFEGYSNTDLLTGDN